MNNQNADTMHKFMGETVKDGRLYKYYLGSDNYVYQYIDGVRNGWLCSFTSWDNALHRILTV